MYPLKVSSQFVVPSEQFSLNDKFTMSALSTTSESQAAVYVFNFRVHPVAREDQVSINGSFPIHRADRDSSECNLYYRLSSFIGTEKLVAITVEYTELGPIVSAVEEVQYST
jgi:hypothetical protein